jgi:hypothetical protein
MSIAFLAEMAHPIENNANVFVAKQEAQVLP